MIIKTKLFELSADALRGKKPGLKVKCLAPACTHRCTLTFETPSGFSSVSGDILAAAFSSLCAGLVKAGEFRPSIVSQKSLI